MHGLCDHWFTGWLVTFCTAKGMISRSTSVAVPSSGISTSFHKFLSVLETSVRSIHEPITVCLTAIKLPLQ